jgi:LysM repeat protein
MKKIIFLTFGFLLLTSGYLMADFEHLGCGARASALGGYTAFSDDVYGIYYNPGGLSWVKFPEMSLDYARLWYGLSDNSILNDGFFGYVSPLKNKSSAIGVAWHNFALMEYYTENNLILSYSNRFTENFGLGVSLKPFYQDYNMDKYTLADPLFDYGKKTHNSAFGIDLGLLWNFYPDSFLGISLLNLNIFESISDIGFSEIQFLPTTINLGIAYRRHYRQDNLFSAGVDMEYSDSDIKLKAGIEKWFSKKRFGLRGGLGFGSKQYYDISLGMGIRFKLVEIDYSFNLPVNGIVGTVGTHRISLVYRFIPLEIAMRPVSIGEYEAERVKLQEKVKELQRKLEEAGSGIYDKKLEEMESLNKEIYNLKRKLRAAESALKKRSAAAPKPKKKPGAKTHTVRAGESLPSIAEKYYGDSSLWKKIYDANKNKIERGQITPGQVLVIP